MPSVSPLRFAGMGAIGGLCAFFLSRLLEVGPFYGRPIYLDLPGEVMLGALAALFGVYLLTASKPEATQTLIFSLACGLFWSPIITATQTYVTRHSDNQTADGARQASTLASKIPQQTTTEALKTFDTASSQVLDALTKLPSVKTVSSRSEVVASSNEVARSLPANKANTATIDAVRDIGLAGVKANAPQVGQTAIDKLKEIAADSPVVETRVQANKAALAVASANSTTLKID